MIFSGWGMRAGSLVLGILVGRGHIAHPVSTYPLTMGCEGSKTKPRLRRQSRTARNKHLISPCYSSKPRPVGGFYHRKHGILMN